MTFIVHSGFISSRPLCVVYKGLLWYVADTLIFLFIAIPNKNSHAVFVCCLLSPPRAVFTDAQPAVLLQQTPVKTTLRILVSGGPTFHTEPLDGSGLHTLHTSCLFCLSELKRTPANLHQEGADAEAERGTKPVLYSLCSAPGRPLQQVLYQHWDSLIVNETLHV